MEDADSQAEKDAEKKEISAEQLAELLTPFATDRSWVITNWHSKPDSTKLKFKFNCVLNRIRIEVEIVVVCSISPKS